MNNNTMKITNGTNMSQPKTIKIGIATNAVPIPPNGK